MNIEARKIAIVQQILSIDNESFIKEIESKIVQLLPTPQPSKANENISIYKQKDGEQVSDLTPPIVEIRENISLDKIVAEQTTTPIHYAEIQALVKEEDWGYSLKELLEAIN